MLMLGSPNGLLTIDINVANDCEVNEEVSLGCILSDYTVELPFLKG